MAILGIFTNIGVSKAQEADNNEGFKIHPLSFSVSRVQGLLDPSRTTENAGTWFSGPISSRVVVDANTIKFICTIPPGQIPPLTTDTIREIYLKGLDNSLVEFLFAIGQPSTPILYDPSGSVTLELQLALTNVDLSGIIQFDFTQATEVGEHDEDPLAHAELVQAVNKAGIYYNLNAGPELFRYRGQNFDEKAEWSGNRAFKLYSGITYTATHTGTDGNLITLVFDGIKTTDQVRAVWNNANPYNTVEHNGTGTEVLPASSQTLSGGTLNVADGDVVYRDTDGYYKKALADGSIKSRVAGIADFTAPIKRIVRSSGFIRRNTGFPVGTQLFLSPTVPGTIEDVQSPVTLGIQVYASPDVILIGTGGGSSGGTSDSGFDAIVTDVPGFAHYPTTQDAIDNTADGSRILVAKKEFLSDEIICGAKRFDFFFHGPETGWSKYLGTAEEQKITFSQVPTSGTWRIEWNLQKTTDLAYNCTALDVQNAINALTGAGLPVTVTGNFTIGFSIVYTSFIDVPQPTFLDPGTDEVQKVTFTGGPPDDGTIRFNFNGQITANLAWNDDAPMLEQYLEDLSNLTSVSVTGSFSLGFTVTFQGVDGKQNQPQITIDNNALTKVFVPVGASWATLVPGEFPASNLKNGTNPVNISVATLVGGTPLGPDTAIQLGKDYTNFYGHGIIENFDSGIDLNGFIGTDIEMVYSGVPDPVIEGGLTPLVDFHTEKSFGFTVQRKIIVGPFGDFNDLWSAVAAALTGDEITVVSDQTLLTQQIIDQDITIRFMEGAKITVPNFLSGNLISLGASVKTENMLLEMGTAGSYTTAYLLFGTQGDHKNIGLRITNPAINLVNAYKVDTGSTAIFAEGFIDRSTAPVTNVLINSSGYQSHNIRIRDKDGGVVFDIYTRNEPINESLTGVVDGVNDTFGLSSPVVDQNRILVLVDGKSAKKSTWTLIGFGASVKFNAGSIPAPGQEVEAFYFPNSPVTTPPKHLDIYDNAVLIQQQNKEINFGTALNVTDNGNNRVTIDVAPGGGIGTPFFEYHTVTGGEFTAKQFTMAHAPSTGTAVSVNVLQLGGKQPLVDFTITGNVFDWNGLGLDGLIAAGYVVHLFYFY